MAADLHLHTTASDGTWTPERISSEAARRGINTIAITDHDTTGALRVALDHCPPAIEIIPGIEISSEYANTEVHILGYFLDVEHRMLQAELRKMRASRVERTRKMVERLNSLGIDISFAEVMREAQGESIGRAHIAQVLWRKGLVSTKAEVFARWLAPGKPAYIPRFRLTPAQGIDLIHGAKGLAVLAHPGLIGSMELVEELTEMAFDGLEVVHSTHSPQQVKMLLELADRSGLLPTGGSDCHGPGGKDECFLGEFTIPDQWVTQMKERVAYL